MFVVCEFWMLLKCKATGTKAPTIFSAHLHCPDEPGITRNMSNISVFMRDCHHGTPRCSSSEVWSSEVPTQPMQMNVYPINMTLESLSTSILGTWNGRRSHLFKFKTSSGIYYPEVAIVQWLPTSAYMIGWHLDSAQAEHSVTPFPPSAFAVFSHLQGEFAAGYCLGDLGVASENDSERLWTILIFNMWITWLTWLTWLTEPHGHVHWACMRHEHEAWRSMREGVNNS